MINYGFLTACAILVAILGTAVVYAVIGQPQRAQRWLAFTWAAVAGLCMWSVVQSFRPALADPLEHCRAGGSVQMVYTSEGWVCVPFEEGE